MKIQSGAHAPALRPGRQTSPLICGQAPQAGRAQGSRLPPAHRLPPGNESRQESLRLCYREPGSGKWEPALPGLLLTLPGTAGAEQGEVCAHPQPPALSRLRSTLGYPCPKISLVPGTRDAAPAESPAVGPHFDEPNQR